MGEKIRNLLKEALENYDFRKVLWAGEYIQVVVQSLKAGEETETETHEEDQISTIVGGEGEVTLGEDEPKGICPGDSVLIEGGMKHCFKNVGEGDLCILVFYAPPRDVEDAEIAPEVPAEGTEEEGNGEDLPTGELPGEGGEEATDEEPAPPTEGGEEGTEDVPPVPTEEVPPPISEEVPPPVEAPEGPFAPEQLPVFPEEGEQEPPAPAQLPA